MLKRDCRPMVLLAAAAGLIVSLASTPSSAVEFCPLASVSTWENLDATMDERYTWWTNATRGGCIRIIIQ